MALRLQPRDEGFAAALARGGDVRATMTELMNRFVAVAAGDTLQLSVARQGRTEWHGVARGGTGWHGVARGGARRLVGAAAYATGRLGTRGDEGVGPGVGSAAPHRL